MNRPEKNDCAEYYHQYIALVPEGPIVPTLENQIQVTQEFLASIDEEKANYRYEANKWSIKEVLGHLIDVERIFACRALWFARENPGPLPSIEQDDLVQAANFDERTLRDLSEEFHHLRWSNILLFRSFDNEISLRKGMASGCEFAVRAIPFIIAGHELHHRKVIQERYFEAEV